MSANLYKAPTSNFWSNSLNGAIDDSVQTITLNSTTGLQSPGYIVIDRENGSGTATPSSREVVKYTGISSNDLTGCTRGADGSTARSHTDGALVEAVFTIGMHNDQRDAIAAEHTVAGVHSILSAPTITQAWINNAMLANATITTSNLVGTVASTATVTNLITPNAILGTTTISTLTMVGGASVAPTVEGQINWRTGDDTLMVGDGAASQLVKLGAWTAFTPTVSGAVTSIGNAVMACAYVSIGKTIIARYNITFGSTTSFTAGNMTVTLPVTAISAAGSGYAGNFYIMAAGAGYSGSLFMGTTTGTLVVSGSASTYTTNVTATNTIPGTFTTNDKIQGVVIYEAA